MDWNYYMSNILELQPHIDFVIQAHQVHAKSPEKSVRSWNHTTPYAIHPIWCATTIATETLLHENIRSEGILVLLYHDVLEDTNTPLPDSLPPDIKESIINMTFPKGTMTQERFAIWSKRPKIRLFKLYDKVSNLLDATWMSPELRMDYAAYTIRLLEDVREHYGKLNIVTIGRAIISGL